MSVPFMWWVGFNVFVLAMLAVDLGVFHRKAHEVKIKEAMTWSAVWVVLSLVFNLGIWLGWFGGYAPAEREQRALEFLTGYLIEKALSVDNVFVFLLISLLLRGIYMVFNTSTWTLLFREIEKLEKGGKNAV